MKDYNEMSDFEISKRVAILLGHNCYYGDGSYTNDNAHVTVKGNGILGWFQPCVEPYDAWRIIVDNGIGLVSENGKIIGATNNSQEFYEPFGGVVFKCLDKNPLRAAMITFLMMKEKEQETK